MFSTPHHYLKAMSLEQPLGVGKAGGTHILGQEKNEEPQSASVQLTGQLAVTFFQNKKINKFLSSPKVA